MGEMGSGSEPARQGNRFHGRAVVGHNHEGDDLAGRPVDAVLDEWAAQQCFGGLDGALQRRDQVCGAPGGGDGARQSTLAA